MQNGTLLDPSPRNPMLILLNQTSKNQFSCTYLIPPIIYASNFLEPHCRASLAPARNNVLKAQLAGKPVKGLQKPRPNGFPRWVRKNNAQKHETVTAMPSV